MSQIKSIYPQIVQPGAGFDCLADTPNDQPLEGDSGAELFCLIVQDDRNSFTSCLLSHRRELSMPASSEHFLGICWRCVDRRCLSGSVHRNWVRRSGLYINLANTDSPTRVIKKLNTLGWYKYSTTLVTIYTNSNPCKSINHIQNCDPLDGSAARCLGIMAMAC